MFPRTMFTCVLFCAALLGTAGCGGTASSNCTLTALRVTPGSATVDHTAAAPANSATFSASGLFTGNGQCVALNTAAQVNSNWTVSDPSVHLSASPTTQITATCTAAVASPVTIQATSATDQTLTGKATLTCN
jgi:hypothetical protein